MPQELTSPPNLSTPLVSIIIPTYNRKKSLLRTLDSLARQTYPISSFEVLVVDDGSTDGTEDVIQEPLPIVLQYVYQVNSGGAVARNRGASEARGDLLIFLDDDMTLLSDYVAALAKAHAQEKSLISRGQLIPWAEADSVFTQIQNEGIDGSCEDIGCFASNNLAIRRKAFFDLGCFRDVVLDTAEHKGGLWADLEFAFRALQHDFTFRTIVDAKIVHRDYAIQNLDIAARRAEMVSKLAPHVLKQYPGLIAHLPMFLDKAPIVWKQDPPRLIARKLARHAASSRPALWGLEQITQVLEQHYPSPTLLRPLYRWIIGGYIFRGYRAGLREYSNTLATTGSE